MSKGKGKPLCKLVKDDALEEDLDAYKALLRDPSHVCRKCGRACNDPRRLCKPAPLDRVDG